MFEKRWIWLKLALAAVALSTGTVFLPGGVNRWTGGGPPAGPIEAVAAAPSLPTVVYAVSDDGALFRSTDSGASWALEAEFPSYQTFVSIAVSPTNPDRVFLSFSGSDVLKTTNGGRSWTRLEPDLTRRGSGYQLVLLGGQPETLIASWRFGKSGASNNVFLSTDGGSTWTPSQLSDVFFYAFTVVGPADKRVLYGVGTKGVSSPTRFFRSTDGGATWEELNWPGSGAQMLAVDPASINVVYAVDFSANLYKTEDSGTTWKKIFGQNNEFVTDVELVPGNARLVYASAGVGLFKSTDAGESWQSQSTTRLNNLTVVTKEFLIGGTYQGISRSFDEGRTWAPASAGLSNLAYIYNLFADPVNRGVAWATTYSALWKTTDAGKTWSQIDDSLWDWRATFSLANPRIIYAKNDKKVLKSTDEGHTWNELSKTFLGRLEILVDSHDPTRLFVSDTHLQWFFPGTQLNVTDYWRSTDGGGTWEKIDFWPLAFDPQTPGVFWASRNGFVKTTDNGLTWTVLTSPPWGLLVVDPSNSDVLYVAAQLEKALFKSTNGGRDWTQIGLKEFEITALAIDPQRSSTLLAAVKQTSQPPGGSYSAFYSLLRSDDGGATWQEFTQGIGNRPVDDLVFGPDHIAFAGAQPGGVFAAQLDDSLFFPHLTSAATGQFTGLAIANVTNSEVQAELCAYDANGVEIGSPIDIKVGSGRQWSSLAGSLLGDGFDGTKNEGWVRIRNVPLTASAFFSVGSPDLALLDTAEATVRPMERFVFSEIRTPPAITRLHVANPSPDPAMLSFQLRDSSGQPVSPPATRQLAGSGVLVTDLADLFPAVSNFTEGMYLDVSSSVPVVPFEQLWRKEASVAGLNGQDSGALRLYSPQYAFRPDVRSTVSVVNLDDFRGQVTLRFMGDNGVQIGKTASLAIEPFGKVYLPDSQLFGEIPETATGYLEITSDGPRMTGSVVFGDPSKLRFASALPLATAGAQKQIFSHLVSSSDFFTGLALLNPGTSAATFVIRVFNRDGQQIASKTDKLDPGKKVSRLLTEYCSELAGQNLDSGYIEVTSDQELFSFALFGAFDVRFLAAIQGRRY